MDSVIIGSLGTPDRARDRENEKELRGGIHAKVALAMLKDDDKTLVELAEPSGVHCGCEV